MEPTAPSTVLLDTTQYDYLIQTLDHMSTIMVELDSQLWWYNTVLIPGFAMILFGWWFFSSFFMRR